jgi:hypothetical protein
MYFNITPWLQQQSTRLTVILSPQQSFDKITIPTPSSTLHALDITLVGYFWDSSHMCQRRTEIPKTKMKTIRTATIMFFIVENII